MNTFTFPYQLKLILLKRFRLMNINPYELPSVLFTDKNNLPSSCGIYFVISEGEVLYIGKSVNILNRWKTHHKIEMIKSLDDASSFRIAWLSLSDKSLLDETEIALITHFKPKLNGAVWVSKENKISDGSEHIRIKVDLAKRIRAEAQRLNMSFLETLYFICLTYFSRQANQSKPVPAKTVMPRPEVKNTDVNLDDEDSYVFDIE